MRTILRYVDGRAIWSDNVPASPALHASRGGTLVVGGESPRTRARAAYIERRRQSRLLLAEALAKVGAA